MNAEFYSYIFKQTLTFLQKFFSFSHFSDNAYSHYSFKLSMYEPMNWAEWELSVQWGGRVFVCLVPHFLKKSSQLWPILEGIASKKCFKMVK